MFDDTGDITATAATGIIVNPVTTLLKLSKSAPCLQRPVTWNW